jgi:hypothetical protein
VRSFDAHSISDSAEHADRRLVGLVGAIVSMRSVARVW